MPFSVDRLQQYAVLFVVIGVVLVIGLRVMGGVRSESYAENETLNETFNATSIPYLYTVNHASDSGFHELLTATCYTDTSQTTEQACNIENASAGEVNVTGGSVDTDLESVDYEYEYEGEAYEGAGQALEGLKTFTSWLPLIALVIVSVVIISLVSIFRGYSGRSGA